MPSRWSRSLILLGVVLALALAVSNPHPAAGTQATCGTWDGAVSADDSRLNVARVRSGTGADCQGSFRVANGTQVLGFGGYTLELRLTEQANTALTWVGGASAGTSTFLTPRLDDQLLLTPVAVSADATAALEGQMTLDAKLLDTALFLIDAALEIVPLPIGCLFPEETLLLFAVRSGAILETATSRALELDVTGVQQELKQVLHEFFQRAQDAVREAGVDCAAQLLAKVVTRLAPGISQTALIAKLSFKLVAWLSVAVAHEFTYDGRPVSLSLQYEPTAGSQQAGDPTATPTDAPTQTPTTQPVTFADPFAYCGAVGTVDELDARWTGPQVPDEFRPLLPQVFTQPGFQDRQFAWRCFEGAVLWCDWGGGVRPVINCAKINTSRDPATYPGLIDHCRQHPNDQAIDTTAGFAGAFAMGLHFSAYTWRCEGQVPVISDQRATPDARGFRPDMWQEVRSGSPAAGGSPSTAGQRSATSSTAVIRPDRAWVETGVQVSAGDEVSITADGIMSVCRNCRTTPAGEGALPAGVGPVPTAPSDSLIGRIGNGVPFFVGTSVRFVAQNDGILQLGVNTTWLPGWGGSWSAEITVTKLSPGSGQLPSPARQVSLNPPSGPAGTAVTADGSGWTPGSKIVVIFRLERTSLSYILLNDANARVDGNGAFKASFVIPPNMPGGSQQITFGEVVPDQPGSLGKPMDVPFTVTSPAAGQSSAGSQAIGATAENPNCCQVEIMGAHRLRDGGVRLELRFSMQPGRRWVSDARPEYMNAIYLVDEQGRRSNLVEVSGFASRDDDQAVTITGTYRFAPLAADAGRMTFQYDQTSISFDAGTLTPPSRYGLVVEVDRGPGATFAVGDSQQICIRWIVPPDEFELPPLLRVRATNIVAGNPLRVLYEGTLNQSDPSGGLRHCWSGTVAPPVGQETIQVDAYCCGGQWAGSPNPAQFIDTASVNYISR